MKRPTLVLAVPAVALASGVVIAFAVGLVDNPLQGQAPPSTSAEAFGPTIQGPPAAASTAGSALLPSAAPSSQPAAVPSPRAPSDTPTFTSSAYGYTFKPLEGSVATAATDTWTPGESWDRQPTADVFEEPGGIRYTVAIAPVEAVGSVGDWIDDWIDVSLPARDEYQVVSSTRCRIGGSVRQSAGNADFEWALVERRHPAQIRNYCGFVDAVVVIGDEAFVLSIHRDGALLGDRARMDLLIKRLLVRDEEYRPIFRSRMYGYTVRMPSHWTIGSRASSPWSGEGAPDDADVADVHYHHDVQGRFTVAATPVSAPFDLLAWSEANLPPPTVASDEPGEGPRCSFGVDPTTLKSMPWTPIDIGGSMGLMRMVRATVDATVVANGRLYVISFYEHARIARSNTQSTFSEIAESFAFTNA